MNDNQENRFNAAVVVQDFLEDNAIALEELPQIAVAKTVLDGYIEKFIEEEGIATTDTTGSADDKEAKRQVLITATLRLTRGAKAFAIDTDNKKLLSKVNLVKTDLSKLRDTQLGIKCDSLKKTITPIIGSLTPYKVLPPHLTAQSDALEAYAESIPEPADQSKERQLAGEEADRQLDLIYELLDKKLDTYMDLLIDDEPELVAEYYLARAITDNAGGGSNGGGTGTGTGGGNQPIVFNGNVTAMMTQATGTFTYSAGISVTLKATTTPLSFQLGQDGVPVGNTKNLAMGATQVFALSDFNGSGNMFIVSNSSPIQGGYTITLG